MCKRDLVSLVKAKKQYRVCLEDIKAVHRIARLKRPTLPRFESLTEDDTET